MEKCPFLSIEGETVLCTKECPLYVEEPEKCPFLKIKETRKFGRNLRKLLTVDRRSNEKKNLVDEYLEDIYNIGVN